jgi:hypothetical protein
MRRVGVEAEGLIMINEIDGDEILEGTEAQEESKVAVNKITWAQVGRVTEPGRYMFKFGWLTITADDLAIWEKYPTAAFTLYSTSVATPAKTEDKTDEEAGEDFRLGTIRAAIRLQLQEVCKAAVEGAAELGGQRLCPMPH